MALPPLLPQLQRLQLLHHPAVLLLQRQLLPLKANEKKHALCVVLQVLRRFMEVVSPSSGNSPSRLGVAGSAPASMLLLHASPALALHSRTKAMVSTQLFSPWSAAASQRGLCSISLTLLHRLPAVLRPPSPSRPATLRTLRWCASVREHGVRGRKQAAGARLRSPLPARNLVKHWRAAASCCRVVNRASRLCCSSVKLTVAMCCTLASSCSSSFSPLQSAMCCLLQPCEFRRIFCSAPSELLH